jgi:hypothetical protein
MLGDKKSGQGAFTFSLRDDLYTLPKEASEHEVKLHGGFAIDNRHGFGQLYYGMPGLGILRISPDLKEQNIIPLPEDLLPLNYHSTKVGNFDGQEKLILPSENGGKVIIMSLEGKVEATLARPEFDEYASKDVHYAPTDTITIDGDVYIADGYGANFISTHNIETQQWKSIFGGPAKDAEDDGKFSTAHGMGVNPVHDHIDICDRPNARIQAHARDGGFLSSYKLPTGSFLCGINYHQVAGRWYAVIGCLRDPQVKDGRPAPIYIIDAETYELLSVIRPKEELGVELAQHIHNVVLHEVDGTLYLVCQAWNPGHYFVLQQV